LVLAHQKLFQALPSSHRVSLEDTTFRNLQDAKVDIRRSR
jgi:hypothetical protein